MPEKEESYLAMLYQEFFDFFVQEHNITLTISEMNEIRFEAGKLEEKLRDSFKVMEAKDLRIGNQIIIDGIIVKIDSRTIFDFDHDSRTKKPIYLNSKMIRRLGGRLATNYKTESYIIGNYLITFLNEKWFLSSRRKGVNIAVIEFVHQLQNLYFALTGEELELKQSLGVATK